MQLLVEVCEVVRTAPGLPGQQAADHQQNDQHVDLIAGCSVEPVLWHGTMIRQTEWIVDYYME
jgi:hypothetical protein